MHTVTTSLSRFSGRCAMRMAATTAAPEEMPTSSPSSLASRLAMSTDSLLDTCAQVSTIGSAFRLGQCKMRKESTEGEECAGRVQCSTTAFCSQWWPCKICRLWLAAQAHAEAEQGTRPTCSAKCRMQSWPQPKRTFMISSISETSRMPGTKPAE